MSYTRVRDLYGGTQMKLLLTSLGLTNESIRTALTNLTGKSIGETRVAFVPTAMHGVPSGGQYLWDSILAQSKIGWKGVSLLELSTLSSIPKSMWLSPLEEVDVIYVDGGNTPYLSYWFKESGFAEELPTLLKKHIYVGVSAGSMVVSHSLVINQKRLKETGIYADEQYNDVAPLGFGSDFTLKLVPVLIRPHLNASYFDHVSMDEMEKACSEIHDPVYIMDDQTALKVVDQKIDVISEGEWKLLNTQ
jgi:dipeptidase E